MRIGPATTLEEMAFIVGTALDKAAIEAVLTGGSAATVYAPDFYQSKDLDFVLGFWSSFGSSAQCLLDLGFELDGDNYVHPDSRFTLDFPPGPLRIGEDEIDVEDCPVLKKEDMVLRILSPTDCVRDRLCWFLLYRQADFSALEQAVAVAKRHEVDLEKIRAWAKAEGAVERLNYFEERLKAV